MTDHDDGKFRVFFREAHERLDPPVPSFAETLRPAGRAAAVAARRSPLALATAIALLIVAGAAWLIVQGGRSALREGEALRLAAELGDWEAPTDFLLQTPGIEYLQEAPRFGAPLDDLSGETTRPTAKEIVR